MKIFRYYVYVDNLGAVGSAVEYARQSQKELESSFGEVGLHTHEADVSTKDIVVLGNEVGLEALQSRTTQKRFWRLYYAIDDVLIRARVAGWLLEIIVGHATFAGLQCRGLLSIFHSVYAFIKNHYEEQVGLLGNSAR